LHEAETKYPGLIAGMNWRLVDFILQPLFLWAHYVINEKPARKFIAGLFCIYLTVVDLEIGVFIVIVVVPTAGCKALCITKEV